MTDNSLLHSPFGEFLLQRFPKPTAAKGKQQPLRAWDAADEYLLEWIHEWLEEQTDTPEHTLILNDSFGALAVALHHLPRSWQSDSFLAHQGCQQNLIHNQRREDASLSLLNSLQWPEQPLDLVVIKIPKTLALLEHQLFQLRRHLRPGTTVVAGGMVKAIHSNTLKTIERILGPTKTSLAKKKARLVFCQPDPTSWRGESPYPSGYRLKADDLPEDQGGTLDFLIHNHANVFSRASLDLGTRLFLQHLPQLHSAGDIIDLGCGNGILGIAAAQTHPQAQVHFVDESYMAVDSARLNVASAGIDEQRCHFQVGNSLAERDSDSADLILNNPPFHQQSVVGDHIAWQMFNDARRCLRPNGSLWVIGNRHLNYHNKLKRLFGNCRTIASDKRFVILEARKR